MKNTEMRTLELKSLCENVKNGDYVKASKRFEHIVEGFIDEKLESLQKSIIEAELTKGEEDKDNDDNEDNEDTDKAPLKESVKVTGNKILVKGKRGAFTFTKSGNIITIDSNTTGETFDIPVQKFNKAFLVKDLYNDWDAHAGCSHNGYEVSVQVHNFNDIDLHVGKSGKLKTIVIDLETYVNFLRATTGSKITAKEIRSEFED